MKIRPRYAKTLMASHRRNQSAKLRRANVYNAFTVRQRYGRRVNRYYWHKKRVSLTEEALVAWMVGINGKVDAVPKYFILGGTNETT
jgi:hypothetical protein